MQFCSSACDAVFGVPAQAVVADIGCLVDRVLPEDLPTYNESIQRGIDNTAEWDFTFRVRVDGEIKHVHAQAQPMRIGCTGGVVWTGVMMDVTAAAKLREMTRREAVATATATRFKNATAFLSHEIRNQLFPLSALLEDMKEAEPSSQWAREIDMALGAQATVTNILDRVLDLAQWETGKFPLSKDLVSLGPMLRAVSSFGTARIGNGGGSGGAARVRFVEDLRRVPERLHVWADCHILKQALTNLVSNAIKFTPSGTITLEAILTRDSAAAATLVVTVTDTGRGMDQDQLRRAMVPYAQIRTAGDAHTGTGLGLPLTAAMVAGHGGNLDLTSPGLGRGTAARVCLPLECVEMAAQQPAAQPTAPLAWVSWAPSDTDVLITDDQRIIRQISAHACRKAGLSFVEATNGQEAVAAMAQQRFALVLMDMQARNSSSARLSPLHLSCLLVSPSCRPSI